VSKFKNWQPFIFAIAIASGILIGFHLNRVVKGGDVLFSLPNEQISKLNSVINYISQEYVDTVDPRIMVDHTIEQLLHGLDPHSSYITPEELQAVNEPLEGNFEGIGVEFHIQEDTIMVVSAIAGGPSEQLGIRAGDRIIKVDGKNVAHTGITNSQVMKLLRGQGGTKVKVTIFRRSAGRAYDFTIVRGKIPIHSVDASYMATSSIGYIKISHFAENTYQEYLDAFTNLNSLGMKKLILDLRSNPGGYLKTAIQIADEFLPSGKLIVYTEGHARPREDYHSTAKGQFERGELAVLIDEGSASASEIVSGAVQDLDRGTIIGRRSYGKGLVQEQSDFPDGSAIRLTVARYYTPTGRCIQKPYDEDYASYENEIMVRLKHGELLHADSIHFADSLRYTTPGGKVVYGGGGIMPDIFVPLDTDGTAGFFAEANGMGLVTQFAYNYLDKHRADFERYTSLNDFKNHFQVQAEMYVQFIAYARKEGVTTKEGVESARNYISNQIKALIARQLWKNEGFYSIAQSQDKTVLRAIELLSGSEVKAAQ
jgi:carboxyl-terminal processing protease